MKVNGAAIYATSASPFKPFAWGRATRKMVGGDTTLYLHVFNWPKDGKLLVPGLVNPVKAAYLLADPAKKSLATESGEQGVTVAVPASATDAAVSVIAMELKGPIEPILQKQSADGSIRLAAIDAICQGKQVMYEHPEQGGNIGSWLNPAETVDWKFDVRKPGRFNVTAEIASQGRGKFSLVVGDRSLDCQAPDTASYDRYREVALGQIEIAAPGKTTLTARPVVAGWSPVNLKSITLTPAK